MSDFTKWFANITTNAKAREWAEKSEERHTRAYQEMLSGYAINPEELLLKVEKNKKHGLIAERGIWFSSVCQHHLLPFFGEVDIVYEPGTGLFGAGKLPRVVDAYARRLQLQENICKNVAETLVTAGAQGAYVQAKSMHTCMVCRGPRAFNTDMFAQYYVGSLNKGRFDEIILSLS